MRCLLTLPYTALVAAGVLASPVRMAGQTPPSGERPDMIARAASWPRWPGSPLRVSTPRFDVAVTTPISRAWLATHDDPRDVARVCSGADVGAADTSASVGFVEWSRTGAMSLPADSGALDSTVVITVAPASPAASPCRGHDGPTAGSIAAGVTFRRYAFHDPGRDVADGRLIVDGVPQAPMRVEGATQRIVLPKGVSNAGPLPRILRIFVHPRQFAPHADGRLPSIRIELTRVADGRSIEIPLPVETVRQVHQDFLAWTIAGTNRASGASPMLPTVPRDAALGRAAELERAGDSRAAAALYHASLYDPDLDAASRFDARVRLALSLAALGDSAAARAIGSSVIAIEPCFTLASSFQPAVRRIFEDPGTRRPRCNHDVRGVALRSVFAPGLGHVHAERKAMALGVALASATALGIAAERHSASRGEYDRYLAANNGAEARRLHARAVDARSDSRLALLIGASVWAAGAIEAIIAEHQHARAMRAIQEYGRLELSAGPSGRGVAISLRRR